MRDIALRPIDDLERAAIFRSVETRARTRVPELAVGLRRAGFEEIERGLTDEDARREARRCLSCGCQKAGDCRLRRLATEYEADPYRFAGARRRFARDLSHPEVVYEPGKCIMCDACVRVAARAGEPLGLAIVGRGFDVSVAVPLGQPLSAGLREAALACASACPTGALAVRTAAGCRFCDECV
jgi:formate dehydrogenase major subunit